MIEDIQILEAAQRAERLKAALPKITVSTDAIFNAIILGKRRVGRPRQAARGLPDAPPDWFTQSLECLKGRSLTVGQFLMHSGIIGATKAERNSVGRWLRASGRMPRKRGGEQLFDI